MKPNRADRRQNKELWMAPVLGYNDRPYRRLWRRHFGPFSPPLRFMAPFLSVTPDYQPRRILKEPDSPWGWDEGEVPQLLGNDSEALAQSSRQLSDRGFTEVNWNLGCPMRDVARKKRGSGLLPYPDQIAAILDRWLNLWPGGKLTVKIRLGRLHLNEAEPLALVLNRFDLTQVILHPRLGVQMYEGVPDLESAQNFAKLCRHPLVWSGDLNTPADLDRVSAQVPSLTGSMLGRGLFGNPFLAADWAGSAPGEKEKLVIFQAFYRDLTESLKERYGTRLALTGRLKGFWEYPLASLGPSEAVAQIAGQIRQAIHLEDADRAVANLWALLEHRVNEGRPLFEGFQASRFRSRTPGPGQ